MVFSFSSIGISVKALVNAWCFQGVLVFQGFSSFSAFRFSLRLDVTGGPTRRRVCSSSPALPLSAHLPTRVLGFLYKNEVRRAEAGCRDVGPTASCALSRPEHVTLASHMSPVRQVGRAGYHDGRSCWRPLRLSGQRMKGEGQTGGSGGALQEVLGRDCSCGRQRSEHPAWSRSRSPSLPWGACHSSGQLLAVQPPLAV